MQKAADKRSQSPEVDALVCHVLTIPHHVACVNPLSAHTIHFRSRPVLCVRIGLSADPDPSPARENPLTARFNVARLFTIYPQKRRPPKRLIRNNFPQCSATIFPDALRLCFQTITEIRFSDRFGILVLCLFCSSRPVPQWRGPSALLPRHTVAPWRQHCDL